MPRKKSGAEKPKHTGKYFGLRLRECREQVGISKHKLAEIVGVEPNYITQMESGDETPSFDTLICIANALHVTTDQLLCDYLDADQKTVVSNVLQEISSLPKEDQRHVEQLVMFEIDYIKNR